MSDSETLSAGRVASGSEQPQLGLPQPEQAGAVPRHEIKAGVARLRERYADHHRQAAEQAKLESPKTERAEVVVDQPKPEQVKPELSKPERAAAEAEDSQREKGEFDMALRSVEDAAREWGVRHELPEGRFVSALLAAVRMTGRLSAASHDRLVKTIASNRDGAELELARAREVARAASLAVTQARNAQIALQVEQETVVARMIDKVFPMFAERLQKALIIREQRVNAEIMLQRYGIVALVTLGLFLGGYLLRLNQDSTATALLGRCLVQPVQSAGAFWCDISNVITTAPSTPPKQPAQPAK